MGTVEEKVISLVAELANTNDISLETPLIGDARYLKSRQLVELCLALEDYAQELGFSFDWTAAAAMSQSRSIFKTVGTLVEHFNRQRL